jgi:glutathione-independent formaldehyde dehydrogenase
MYPAHCHLTETHAKEKWMVTLADARKVAKSHAFFIGQTPVMKYNRALMMAVLHDRINIAKAMNATLISLDDAPRGYADFDSGVARKFVIDPHGLLRKRA